MPYCAGISVEIKIILFNWHDCLSCQCLSALVKSHENNVNMHKSGCHYWIEIVLT